MICSKASLLISSLSFFLSSNHHFVCFLKFPFCGASAVPRLCLHRSEISAIGETRNSSFRAAQSYFFAQFFFDFCFSSFFLAII
nr:MAG TPA: hypothetical protein [Bacteriophage sp.]